MLIDVASRAPHGRKYGATFAEHWSTHDGTTIVAVGAVNEGEDPVAVSDLLRNAVRALVTSPAALRSALAALDDVVTKHARDNRDHALAASVILVAASQNQAELTLAGAGVHVHVTIISGQGEERRIYVHGVSLGTGMQHERLEQRVPLALDDALVVTTVPVTAEWWANGDRTARALLHNHDVPESSAAVIARA